MYSGSGAAEVEVGPATSAGSSSLRSKSCRIPSLLSIDERRRCMRDAVRYLCRASIRVAARSAKNPILSVLLPIDPSLTLFDSPLTLRPGCCLLGLELVEDLRHSHQLGGYDGDRLWREEALPQREPTRLADRPFQVARPHVLDEQEACRATRVKRSRHRLDLLPRETEGVALYLLLLRRASRLFLAFELEAEQRTDDGA